MSFKKKAAAIIASVLAVFAVVAGGLALNANAAVTDAPATEKKLIDNGDGTYTIALSVTGEAASSSTTEVTKANVVLVLDTSSSMNNSSGSTSPVTYTAVEGTPAGGGGPGATTYYGTNAAGEYIQLYWRQQQWRTTNQNNGPVYSGTFYTRSGGESLSRFEAEKDALTKDGGIIDNLLSQNVAGDPVKSDIIEVAIASFGGRGATNQTFTTNGESLKTTINGLGTTQGTNWEEGLQNAKTLADNIHASQPNEAVYIIFLTDGEPTTHAGDYTVNTTYREEWAEANDDARGIVTAGYTFYGLFTWGSSSSSSYLSSLVNYAYKGTGTYNTALDPAYAQYFTDASDTETLIAALNQIVHDITTGVGYTNVEMTDGVTSMTASNVKASASGEITNMKYYRSGGSYGNGNGGLGTEWTDAPKAKINDKGEVDWDLGSIVLEDGVTYTMTFVVWPKQASLDLVADLNNGIKDYNDLTADEKSQIQVSGGHYSLKTNTDYPTITYSTVTTTTVDGETTTVVSDPQTTTIKNPDPVGLAEDKLNAVKSWDDSLDPSQREEIDDVVLYLLVDNKPYYIDPATEQPIGVTLTEESNWTETGYIAIAPGLMVTEDSPAYDPNAVHVTWEGKTWAIIEDGHEYVFEESDINNHFELTAYTHHPMIMGTKADGTPNVVDVIFTKDGDTITGIESVAPLGTNLSATNTLRPGINIQKKVVDENGEEIDSTDPFEVTVYLVDENGETLPDKTTKTGETYNIDYRIYYGPNNPNYDEAAGGGRSDHIYVTGTSITETLYVGDVIRVVNVEAGACFRVEETEATGYDAEKTEYKYEIMRGDGDYEDYDTDPVTIGGETYYVTEGNSASQVTVTNTYSFGDLTVTKTVEVESGDEEQAKATEFEFTFKLYSDDTKATELEGLKYDYTIADADGNKVSEGTITEGDTFKLKDGETITIAMLPDGAYYEIVETEVAGFETEATGDTGTIVKDDTVEAEFTNTYSVEPITASFPVKKVLENGPATWSYTITVAANGSAPTIDAMTATVTNEANTATFGPFTFEEPGEYTYTVTESGTVPGVVDDKDATTGKTVTVTVEDNGDGTLTATVDPETGIEFTNTYEVTTVSVEKVWEDADDQDGFRPDSVQVQLLADDEAYGDPVTLNEDNDWAYTWTDLPVYTDSTGKTEVVYNVDEVTDDEVITGTDAAGTYAYEVEGDAENGFTVTNTHTPELTKVEGTKVWDDDKYSGTAATAIGDANEYAREPIEITLTGSDGNTYKVTLDGTADTTVPTTAAGYESEAWKYSFINLPKYKGGEEITYTVSEGALAGWTSEVADDGTITNTPDEIKIVGDGEVGTSITIKKIDGATEGTLAGAEFTLTDPEGKETVYTTNDKGEITIDFDGYTTTEDVDVAKTTTYTLEETKAPEGYTADGTKYTITLTEDLQSISKVTRDSKNVWEWLYDLIADIVAENFEDGVLTVENPPILTKVTVDKVWNDNDDQDGVRPENLTFTLTGTADGKEVYTDSQTVKVADDGSATYTWEDLATYYSGNEVTYKVTEAKIETADYTTSYSDLTGTVEDGFTVTVTNTYTPEQTSTSAEKVWDDADNQDGFRPTSVQVQLFADGVAEGDPVTLDASNSWKTTWTGLPKYKDGGTEIVYTVNEIETNTINGKDAAGTYAYTVVKNEDGTFTVTNTHTPELTKVEGTKVWDDEKYSGTAATADGVDNKYAREPIEITLTGSDGNTYKVTLDGTVDTTVPTTAAGYESAAWKYSFINLPKYAEGKVITYTVSEGDLAGWTSEVADDGTITNTPDEIKVVGDGEVGTSITIQKIDEYAEGTLAGAVFTLYDADGEVVDTFTTNDKGEITIDFDGYTTTEDVDVAKTDTYTLKETKAPDGYIADDTEYTITVTEELVSITRNAQNVWEWLYDLIADIDAENFDDETGTLVVDNPPVLTEVTVDKVWNDDDDKDGLRPDKLTFTLTGTAAGEEVYTDDEEVVVEADGSATITWQRLPIKYNGEDIVYAVTEAEVDGYTTSYSAITGTVEDGFKVTVTNTHKSDVKEVFYGDTETMIDGHLVAPGQTLTYVINYTNNTNGTATVTVEDTIPQYTTVDTINDGGKQDGDKITWTIEDVVAGASGSVSFSVTVNDDAAGSIENEAVVRVGDNESTTNAVTTTIPVKDVKDASGASIADGSVQVGDTLTYEVSFKIDKPVTDAVVKDTIPTGTEYVAGSAKATWATDIDDSGDPITWTFSGTEDKPLAAGTYTATFQVKVTEAALQAGTIENTAIININDDPEVNTNTVVNTPESGSLTISKAVVNETLAEGKTDDTVFTFTVELKDKNGTELTGTYSYTGDVTGTITSGGTIELKGGQQANITGLPAGATYTVTEAKANGYTTEATGDTGTIAKDATQTAAFTNTREMLDEPIEVTKAWDTNGDTTPPEGATVTFELYADGQGTGLKVVLDGTADTAPTAGAAAYEAKAWVADFINLPKTSTVDGHEIAYTVVETVTYPNYVVSGSPAENGGTITNTHTDDEKDVFYGDTETSIDGHLVSAGDVLTYTITYVNNENDPATVTVEDTIPQYTKYNEDADPEAKLDGNKLVWTIEDVPAGGSGTVTFSVTVDDDATEPIENEAVVRIGENESKTNSVTTNIPVKDVTDASGTSVNNGTIQVGDELTYTITFTIDKAVDTATIKDDVPAGTEFVSADNDGKLTDGTVNWDLGALDAGTYTVSFTVKVLESALQEGEIENTAFITVNDDPEVHTNVVNTTPEVGALVISKTVVVPDGFEIDKDKAFTFTVTLTDKNGDALTGEYKYTGSAEGTITSGGTVQLKHGEYILIADLPAGAKYSIEEKAEDGYTATKATIDGTITADETSYATAAFENTYGVTEPAEVDPPVQKIFEVPEGLTPNDIEGKFKFEIKSVSAPEAAKDFMPENTVIYNSEGFLLKGETDLYEFGTIVYTVPGTYVYTVTESGSVPGVTNDTESTKTLTVTVTDNGDGTLSAAMDPEVGQWTFTNSYSVEPTDITLSASKTLEVKGGDNAPDVSGKYTLTLTDADGNVVDTKTNPDGKGTAVDFKAVEFTEPGEYKFTVTESGSVDGVTNGTASYDVTVTVTDNGDGTLTAEVTSGDQTTAFVNTYDVAPTEFELSAAKILEVKAPANNAPDVSGAYTITIAADSEGAPLPATTSITNADGEGTATSFGKIEYTAPGDYQYTITESGTVEGVTNGQTSYTVKVTVTDNGDGTLSAAVTAGDQTTTFTNTYSVTPVTLPTEDQFTVQKDLTGTPLTAGAFEFQLTASDPADAPMPEKTAATNDADGKVVFDTITYDEPGTYTYKITETDGGKGGYTYDTNEVTVTVTVVDNGKGALEATVAYDGELTFVNTYEANGEITLTAKKDLEGRALEADQFSFELVDDATGEVIDTATNNESGAIQFTTIKFDQTIFDKASGDEAAPADETPTIVEKSAPVDDSVVTDDAVAAAVPAIDEPEATEVEVTEPEATEVEADDVIVIDELQGEVEAESNIIDDIVTAIANFFAPTIAKAAEGDARTATFNYTIREVNDGAAGYTYDEHEIKVTVTVVDNGDGTLTATASYDGETTFTNTYKAEGEVQFENISKTVEGKELEEGQFNFQLTDVDNNVIETVSNDAEGNVAFSAIAYTEADAGKTFTYQITEVNDGQLGYTYDATVYTVTVTVTDNGDGTLTCEYVYTAEDEDVESIEFTNPYVPLEAVIELKGQKTLEGKKLEAGMFEFEILTEDGTVLFDGITNNADGSINFGTFIFETEGTYTFIAREIKGNDANTTYDTEDKVFTVVVTDEDGQLVATVTCNGAEDGIAQFKNTYKEPEQPKQPETPKTGDVTPIVAIEAMAGFAFAMLAGGALLRRRDEK